MTHINEVLVAQNNAIIRLLEEVNGVENLETARAIKLADDAAAKWIENLQQSLKDEGK